mgnify:CR=1 FL=1
MKTAQVWAEESYCKKKKVGAVIARKGRIIAQGYNGTVAGSNNICECGDSDIASDLSALKTKDEVIHAEVNAIAYAAQYGISTKGTTVYVTLSPCIECSKVLIQAGVKKVIYLESYKGDAGAEFLNAHGVKTKKFKEQ